MEVIGAIAAIGACVVVVGVLMHVRRKKAQEAPLNNALDTPSYEWRTFDNVQ